MFDYKPQNTLAKLSFSFYSIYPGLTVNILLKQSWWNTQVCWNNLLSGTVHSSAETQFTSSHGFVVQKYLGFYYCLRICVNKA